MPTLNFDALSEEQQQRVVNALIAGMAKELTQKSLLEAFATGGPPVDTTFRRSPCAHPDFRRPGEWTIERRLVESPSRMTIDAEYEVMS